MDFPCHELVSELSDLHRQMEIDDEVYVMEECMKRERGYDAEKYDEACDILITTLVYLYGLTDGDFSLVKPQLHFKTKRAIAKWKEKGLK